MVGIPRSARRGVGKLALVWVLLTVNELQDLGTDGNEKKNPQFFSVAERDPIF
jgi:hypothetical protein